MKLRFILGGIAMLFCGLGYGQNDVCGAAPTDDEKQFMDANSPVGAEFQLSGDEPILNLPIVFHIIYEGASPGVSHSEIVKGMELLNEIFLPARVQFYDTLYPRNLYKDEDLVSTDLADVNQLLLYPFIPNVINIYIVNEIKAGTEDFIGYSNFPQSESVSSGILQDKIFIKKGYVDNTNLAHELGHYVGLYHTHHDVLCEGIVKNAPDCSQIDDCELDLGDCETTGDRCCDTNPVPVLWNLVNSQSYLCEFLCEIIELPSTFRVQERLNLMSYLSNFECNDILTKDQKDRVYFYAYNFRNYIWQANQSEALTVISPQYGSRFSWEERDIYFFTAFADPVNIEYREVNSPIWIPIEENYPTAIGINPVRPAYSPIFYGSGTRQYELRVSYSDNGGADIGSPFEVKSIYDFNEDCKRCLNTSLNLAPCCDDIIAGNTVEITWDMNSITAANTINLWYSMDGGFTQSIIARNIENTGSFTWYFPEHLKTDYLIFSLFYQDGEKWYFDITDDYTSIIPPPCKDGIQNGEETGIDCGGTSCIPCPTCEDGILNEDEIDVDCGGASCPPCSGNSITKLEYFIDTDPGIENGTSVAISNAYGIVSSFTVDLTGISSGIHTLYTRVKDETHWSFLQSHTFFVGEGSISNNNINYLEYFLNEDPGIGEGISLPITANTEVGGSYTIDLSGLPFGMHVLNVRARTNSGIWSFVERKTFLIEPNAGVPNIVELEYFVDTEPGIGLANSIFNFNEAPDIQSTYPVDLTGLSTGAHQLNVRAKDDKEIWSDLAVHNFEITAGEMCHQGDYVLPNNPILSDTYQATTQLSSNGVINSPEDVTFIAGESIVLQAGFHAKAGSNFLAKIGSCNTLNTQVATETYIKNDKRLLNVLQPKKEISLSILPNPSKYSTNLIYQLPKASSVEIEIYNLSGQLLINIPPSQIEAGAYTKRLNTEDLASGIYFVVLKTSDVIKSQKMVVE